MSFQVLRNMNPFVIEHYDKRVMFITWPELCQVYHDISDVLQGKSSNAMTKN